MLTKDDTTEVPYGANSARHDYKELALGSKTWQHGPSRLTAVAERMYMRHEREIGTVASFEEDSHSSYQSKHRAFRMGIKQSDCDEESAAHDTHEDNPCLLDP